jgi:hypothetical protein
MLPATDRIRETKYYHELMKGELYSLYGRFCDDWKAEFPFGNLQVDCTMTYKGIRVHFEVDRGSEPIETLYAKIDNYIRLAPHTDKTIFVLTDGVKRRAIPTGSDLYKYLIERKRGRQFSWTDISMIKKDPFGSWFFNSLNERLSLDDLCSAQ